MAKRKGWNGSCAEGCPVEAAWDLIGGKWKGVVLYHLLKDKTLRFGELCRRLPDVTQRLLTKQLRELEADDVVARKVSAEVPPKVESLEKWGTISRPTSLR